jgi:hypothetical protein
LLRSVASLPITSQSSASVSSFSSFALRSSIPETTRPCSDEVQPKGTTAKI